MINSTLTLLSVNYLTDISRFKLYTRLYKSERNCITIISQIRGKLERLTGLP